MVKVSFVQPVVPNYRLDFFNKISENENIELNIFASNKFPNSPDSIKVGYNFNFYILKLFSLGNTFQFQNIIPFYGIIKQSNVVIISGNLRILSNILLINYLKKNNIPIVWWSHGWEKKNKFMNFIRVHLIKKCKSVLLYNQIEIDKILPKWKGPKLFSIQNTVNNEIINHSIAETSTSYLIEFKKKYNLNNKKVIIFTSRIEKSKNLNLLFDVFKELLENDNDYRLVIIGNGSFYNKIIKNINKRKLSNNIILVGENYDPQTLAPWFLSSNLLVYPGNIGLSIAHAFAYGLPVITHDKISEHNPEFYMLKENFNGLTFKYGSKKDLHKKIIDLFADTEFLNILSTNAKFTIDNHFTFKQMVQNTIDLIYYSIKK